MAKTQATVWQQFKYLLYRNVLLKTRKPKEMIQEVLMPVYFVVILVVLTILIPNTTYGPVPYTAPVALPAQYLPRAPGSGPVALGYVPKSDAVASLMNLVVDGSTFVKTFSGATLIGFDSDEDAVDFYYDNMVDLLAVVEFATNADGSLPDNVTVTFRFNGSYAVSTNSISQNAAMCRMGIAGTCAAYISTGFVDLQTALIEALALQELDISLNLTGAAQAYPLPAYTTTSLVLLNLTAIYMVIAFSPLVQFLLVNIVVEKEKKIKEGMAMMGLKEVSYFLSWFVIYGTLMILTTLIMSVLATIFIFPGSNFLPIWLMLFLYGLSMIAYSFALTPFFTNSKVAGVVGALFTLLISIIYVPLAGTDVQANAGAKWGCSLLSPVALALGMSEAVAKVAAGIPINMSTIFEGTQAPGYSISSTILILIIDTVLYFFLAWYLDNVVPGEYGVKRPWYFLFTGSYWSAKKHAIEKIDMASLIDTTQNEDVEKVPAELHQQLAVDIRNVRKVFPKPDNLSGSKKKVALDGVSLQMFEGQIFGLLGHNGAGKSTLVSILSGLFSQTSGSVTAFGYDSATSMNDLRSIMGVCPQQNILFDELTVQEHLVVFAGFKGVPKDKLDAEVQRILRQSDLVESAQKRSVTLSGGQKRKLCVGMALIGDPQIIFLDEPTAGMDPYSRRKLWDLLQNSKPGRVIMITSHFLDEIDILADRKAILTHGKVRCCGSSLFLKNRFGLGYYIAVERKDGVDSVDSEAVLKTIQSHVPGATLDHFTGAELAFRLPLADVKSFPALFDTLDSKIDSLGLAAYSISMTSLEEVFLSLENETTEDGVANPHAYDAAKSQSKRLESVDVTKTTSSEQLRYLTYAKMRQILRNPRAYMLVVFLPIVFLIVGLVIYKTTPTVDNTFANIDIGPSLYAPSAANPVPVGNNTGAPIDTLLGYLNFPVVDESVAGLYPSLINSTSAVAYLVNDTTTTHLEASVLVNTGNTHALPAYWGAISSAAYSAAAQSAGRPGLSVAFASEPLPFLGAIFDVTSYFAIILIGMSMSLAPGGFAVEIIKERERKIRHQLNVMGLHPWVYWTASFLRDFSLYSIPAIAVLILVPAFSITAFTGAAMPTMFLTLIIYMPTVILFAYLLSFLFTKTETVTSTLPPVLNILALIPYYAISAVDQSGYRHEAMIAHYCVLAVNPTYGIMGALHYMYMVSFVASLSEQPVTTSMYFDFSSQVPGTLLMMCGHLIIFACALMFIEWRNVHKQSAPPLQKKSKSTVDPERQGLLDVHDDGDGDDDVSQAPLFEEDSDVRAERLRSSAGSNGSGLNEYDRQHVISVHNLRKTFSVQEPVKPDGSVNGSGSGTSSGNDFMSFVRPKKGANDLHTVQKAVVNNISLGVKPGECFGLLGPNGAGKTTTLSMITGEIVPSKGYCVVSELDTRTHLREAFDLMGYCPQFDALFDDLTVAEHLTVYAAIKGVPKHLIPDRVKAFIDTLNIGEFTDKVAKDLSGGTKRKLSFCISMIGSPKVAVLDEPSTGMDPSSRRFMWDVILENVKNRAAILTTHSMEEADALCSRIAIMVKGQLRCLGTSAHLKHKYGEGFTLEMKTTPGATDAIKQLMDNTFKLHRLEEEYAGRLIYKIPSNAVSVGQVFGVLEDQKAAGNLEEYAFSQTTLEQVFIEFAKQQEEHDQS